MRNIIIAAGLVACALGAARVVAALPEVLRGAGTGPPHTSEEVLFETVNGGFR